METEVKKHAKMNKSFLFPPYNTGNRKLLVNPAGNHEETCQHNMVI